MAIEVQVAYARAINTALNVLQIFNPASYPLHRLALESIQNFEILRLGKPLWFFICSLEVDIKKAHWLKYIAQIGAVLFTCLRKIIYVLGKYIIQSTLNCYTSYILWFVFIWKIYVINL